MRGITVAVLILLLISPLGLALERQIPLEDSEQSDKGIYDFLSILLDMSGAILNAVLDESNSSVKQLDRMGVIINETSAELVIYQEKGIETRLNEYFPPFVDLYLGLSDVVNGQMAFLMYFPLVQRGNTSAYLLALSGVERGKGGISKVEMTLRDISALTFRTSSGSTTLNTEELENTLKKVRVMFERYERLLRRYHPPESPLVIYASTSTSPIYSNVTVHGLARGMTAVTLHLIYPNGTEEISGHLVSDGTFYRVYNFTSLGTYKVFATGYLNGSIVRSNVLTINVTRIPTSIVVPSNVSSYIGQYLRVWGILQDYLGRPVPNATIKVLLPNDTILVNTTLNGSFWFGVTSFSWGNMNVQVVYGGSDLYDPCEANVSVFFSGRPLKITLSGPEEVRVGENFTIHVNLTAIHPVTIRILVDNETYSMVKTSSPFNVSLSLNTKGDHIIAAVFEGDELYAPSRSNPLTVKTVSGLSYLRIFAAMVTIVGTLLVYHKLRGHGISTEGVTDEELVAILRAGEEETKRRGKRLNDYYRHVYMKLLALYGRGRSTTPRELLSLAVGEPFEDHLKAATEYHEKYFYAMRRLTAEEIVDFIRSVANVIFKLIVRDEL